MWCDALPLLIQMEWHKAHAGLRAVGNQSTTSAVSAWAQVGTSTHTLTNSHLAVCHRSLLQVQ